MMSMKKDLLMLGFAVLIVIVLLSGTKIQSVEEYYLTHSEEITEDSNTVTVSIDCSAVLNNWDNLSKELQDGDYIPEDGMILPPTKYVLRKGDTAFDVLKRVTKYEKIPMEYQGAEQNIYETSYIEGINYLYEFSCGPLSGWMYKVNEEFPGIGCSRYELKDGDHLVFIYTCDLGRDIGGSYEEGNINK